MSKRRTAQPDNNDDNIIIIPISSRRKPTEITVSDPEDELRTQQMILFVRWLFGKPGLQIRDYTGTLATTAATTNHNRRQRGENGMARFAEYLRRSSPGEEDKNYSIGDQERDIAERWPDYAKHELVLRYSDPGGRSYTLNRPVFQQMMRDAKDKKFDLLLVGRFDRFSRIQGQQAVAIYQLEKYGVKVISATQPVPDGPIGTLIRNNYAFASELELLHVRERTYNGKRSRVQDGKLPPVSVPLYGYRFEDVSTKERYIPDPETSVIVVRIFDLVIAGVKLRAIARMLTDEGVPTPSQVWARQGLIQKRKVGTVWRHGTLWGILTNPAYVGKHAGFRQKIEMVDIPNAITGEREPMKRLVARDEDDPDRVTYDESVCPAIVDPAKFQSVQAILQHNRDEAARNLRTGAQLLLRNGIAVCGYCNSRMVARWSKSNKAYRYHCRVGAEQEERHRCDGGRFNWDAAELDEMVWRFIVRQFERPEIIAQKYEQWKADTCEGRTIEQDHLQSLRDNLALAEKKRANATDLATCEDDPDQRAEYQLTARREAQRVRNLTAEIEDLQTAMSNQDRKDKVVMDLMEAGTRAIEQLRHADFDSRRRILYALQVVAVVRSKSDPNSLQVHWGNDRLHRKTMEQLEGATLPALAPTGTDGIYIPNQSWSRPASKGVS